MRKVLLAACALVVVGATVAVALLLVPDAPGAFIGALAGLVIAEIYAAVLLLVFMETRTGDANNFIPAVLGAVAPLVISLVVLLVGGLLGVWQIVLLVLAWAAAVVLLLLSLAANHAETKQARLAEEARAADPRAPFRASGGKA
ncbi:hypothetical protein [Gulosibacter sp. 10]|uniref:hypothetical protein n=1 Tax=Gulosibacter sp. 10 TaxID=1255570 RepID=UPI00097F49CF|nr:hypothetical protein [Gulosibacter sp. 10]SJM67218.1 hypothetical protein FM112_12350 [Gulosibacter sp. 10]